MPRVSTPLLRIYLNDRNTFIRFLKPNPDTSSEHSLQYARLAGMIVSFKLSPDATSEYSLAGNIL
jgi:hypothetical protein